MSFFEICGISVFGAMLSLLTREAGGRHASLVSVATGVLVLFFLVGALSGVIDKLIGFSEAFGVKEPLSLSLRAIGLGYVTEMGSGICRDLGESGIAARLEAAGRVAIFALALPTLYELLRLAVEAMP